MSIYTVVKVVAFLVAGLFFYLGWKNNDELAAIEFEKVPYFENHRQKKAYENKLVSMRSASGLCYFIATVSTIIFLFVAKFGD